MTRPRRPEVTGHGPGGGQCPSPRWAGPGLQSGGFAHTGVQQGVPVHCDPWQGLAGAGWDNAERRDRLARVPSPLVTTDVFWGTSWSRGPGRPFSEEPTGGKSREEAASPLGARGWHTPPLSPAEAPRRAEGAESPQSICLLIPTGHRAAPSSSFKEHVTNRPGPGCASCGQAPPFLSLSFLLNGVDPMFSMLLWGVSSQGPGPHTCERLG